MLSKLPSGKRIFIDSNIFIYHFLGLHESCSLLLSRIEHKEFIGVTSSIVIAEVWHRLMIAEAIEAYKLSPRNTVTYLKKHPDYAKRLSRSSEAISCVPKMNITIWSLTKKTFYLAQTIQQEYGLLVNDSLHLAIMRQHRIKNIATNDSDFERIKDIKVWKPSEK